jgi:Flp pilus assembly pilin Flp
MKESKKIIKNQNGQGVMEYIILTGLVGIFCLGAVKKFGSSLETRMNQINKKIVKQIDIR